jgi:hypothetical protein
MITIVNCHYQTPDIYCGRKWKGYEASPLGNPFRVGSDRGDAIERYRHWLWQQIKDCKPPVLSALRVILSWEQDRPDKTVSLGCWCHPKPCHCEVIIKALRSPVVLAILDEHMPF